MNKESETTISVSLNQMYELAIDHAIGVVKKTMFEIKDSTMAGSIINSVLGNIINDLQNLKAKG